jgi:hypothetical protein
MQLPRCSTARRAILFVGRLELRKGIDVLLDAAVPLLKTRRDIELWIAGDDTLALSDGRTVKEHFISGHADQDVKQRILFLGQVTEEDLRWLYAECAVVVVPSRFESFGLTAVEAMMFAKPVIASRSGGADDVLTDGEDGLLVEPGNADTLLGALAYLLDDPSRCLAMGRAGRAKFETRFTVEAVVADRIAFLSRFARTKIDWKNALVHGGSAVVPLSHGEHGLALQPHSVFVLDVEFPRYQITFFRHAWSGLVEIGVDEVPAQMVDLFSEREGYWTIEIDTSQATYLRIKRLDRACHQAHGTEVIISMVQANQPLMYSFDQTSNER